jgi:hypothetical protein
MDFNRTMMKRLMGNQQIEKIMIKKSDQHQLCEYWLRIRAIGVSFQVAETHAWNYICMHAVVDDDEDDEQNVLLKPANGSI